MLGFEQKCWARGLVRLAGVDEVGRGPLAGPVVAAAVVLERGFVEREQNALLAGMTDSKKLSAAQRERFAGRLRESPHVHVGIGTASVEEIDRLNILQATHRAMVRAVNALLQRPDFVLVDGRSAPVFPCEAEAIVGGDGRSLSIAAASIVAKVYRDEYMRAQDRLYPQYGFARHKGYGSRAHMQALFRYGPCPLHRRTFRPVGEAEAIQRAADSI